MYYLPYFILGLFLLILYIMEQKAINSKETPKPYRIICLILLFVFVGLRGFIFSDFILYYSDYNHYPELKNLTPVFFEKERYENGFIVFICLSKTLGLDYFSWVFIGSVIDILVLYITFKRYCKSAILPFVFFMAFNGLVMEFNLLRNMKAMDLFLLSLPYLQNKKILPYMLLNLIGCLFHTSAILYICCYFILNKELPRWLLWSGIIIVNIIYLFNIPVFGSVANLSFFRGSLLGDTYMHYLENDQEQIKFSIHYFERLISIVLVTVLYSKVLSQRRSNLIFYNCLWLYYVSFTLCYEYVVLSERIPFLFVLGYWILYPNILNLRYKFYKYVNMGIWLLLSLKMYSSFNQKAAEYSNIIFGIPNYSRERSEAIKELSNSK